MIWEGARDDWQNTTLLIDALAFLLCVFNVAAWTLIAWAASSPLVTLSTFHSNTQ